MVSAHINKFQVLDHLLGAKVELSVGDDMPRMQQRSMELEI